MKRMLWNLAKRAFRRCLLEDVDAVLLAAYRKRLIDTCALHEIDAAFKYGSEVISKRATYAGETRGVFHGGRAAVILLAIACCAPAYAADPAKPSRGQAAAYTGTAVVLTGDERTEYITARASAAFALTGRLGLFARAELGGTQNGGGLQYGDLDSFRAVEGVLGFRYALAGPLRLSLLGGTTLSAEGQKDAPVDARLYTAGGTLGLPLGDGGYLEAGGAYDQRVGGAAALFTLNLPIRGAFTVVDASVPLSRTALERRAYQVRIGAQVRVKKLLF